MAAEPRDLVGQVVRAVLSCPQLFPSARQLTIRSCKL